MLMTPTFQVFLADNYYDTDLRDVITECAVSCCLVGITIIYGLWLEGQDAWKMVVFALIDNVISYALSLCVFSFGWNAYWIGLV